MFPIITERVRVADDARLQQGFRGTLGLGALTFVVPWVIGHASPHERALCSPTRRRRCGGPSRSPSAVSGRGRERLFGTGLSAADRRLVRRMQRVNRVHQALVRLTGGRWGHG